jgi:hypothetical protein
VALGWLWGRNPLAINTLWGGFDVAFRWLCALCAQTTGPAHNAATHWPAPAKRSRLAASPSPDARFARPLPECLLGAPWRSVPAVPIGYPVRCCFPQLGEAGPPALLIQQPIEPAKPVPPLLLGFPGYGPQGGWPVVTRRSYGTGFLCRLRCHVDPLARFGPLWRGLPRATMGPSDSQLTLAPHFLSLQRSSRLALAISAAGVSRASQVPDCSFLTCHALRPRQAKRSLTGSGLARIGFRERRLRPRLRVCSVSGLDCLSRVRVLLNELTGSCFSRTRLYSALRKSDLGRDDERLAVLARH